MPIPFKNFFIRPYKNTPECPNKIFKSLSSCEHVESLIRGKVILRSKEYYLSHPCQNLRDSFEHQTAKSGYSAALANPTLIFCFHKHKPKCKDHIVAIHSPCDLFSEIKQRLSLAIDSSYFGEVVYRDMNCENPDHTDFRKINFYCERVYLYSNNDRCDNLSVEIAFHKNSKFNHQNEIRMCFLVCPEKLSTICQSDIKIKFWKRFYECDPSYPEKPVVYREQELNFNDWKTLRNCAQGGERDSFWFEAHINVSHKLANTFINLSHQN